ncbi:MAG: hypothetical protein N2749_05615 [Clostridia bacterium]|nr:hypothetical protein [Clostridia bacterium]
MVFVALGTQKQQAKRIIDYVVNSNELKNEEILIQNGHTTFEEKYDNTRICLLNFLSKEELESNLDKADLVITHGGVGSIFTALSKNKKVIAIPRLKKYFEHMDDHQTEVCEQLEQLGYISCFNVNNLTEKNIDVYDEFDNLIKKAKEVKYKKYEQDTSYLKTLEEVI